METVEFLLQCGAETAVGVRFMEAENVQPIHIATQFGSRHAVKKLIEFGVNVNVTQKFNDTYGLTSLHIAAAEGQPALVRTLIKAGADVTLATSEGKTAYDIAKAEGFRDVARQLKNAARQAAAASAED